MTTTDLAGLIAKLEPHVFPEPNTGCWLWGAGASSNRAGQLYGSAQINGKTVRVHRLFYEAHHGPAGNMFVCHRCDTTLCVNPDHLFLGTAADNNADRRAKERDFWFADPERASAVLAIARASRTPAQTPRGSRQGAAKLTEDAVRLIRQRASEGIPQRRIAIEFGVKQTAISMVVSRRSWRHVP